MHFESNLSPTNRMSNRFRWRSSIAHPRRSAKEMKPYLILFFALCLTACATTEEKRVSFDSLGEFLAWADKQIEKGNDENLIATQAMNSLPYELRLHQIDELKKQLGNRKLSEIFKYERFPEAEDRFKLGGHFDKLGCVHIDFAKKNKEWFLRSITYCR